MEKEKTKQNKKETTLSVLKDIRALLTDLVRTQFVTTSISDLPLILDDGTMIPQGNIQKTEKN